MRNRSVGLAMTLALFVLLASVGSAQVVETTKIQATSNPLNGDRNAVTQGAVLFRQECVFCHGVSARGGMRGPDLTTGNWSHGGSDTDLATTISAGIPGTAMPPNRLTEEEIWQIVSYLRTVQQPPATPTGDAKRGETLFFGATRCSSCHMVGGRGGRLGPELTTVGSARSRAYIVESIREPGRHLTEIRPIDGGATLHYDAVTVVTGDGRTITGVPMNEDTFTIQLIDTSERVHSFDKKSLKSVRHENRSLMPAYDANRLNAADLDDVVAYLQTLRAGSSARKGGSHDNQ
jgi:putative heme-binding domain-containing protein